VLAGLALVAAGVAAVPFSWWRHDRLVFVDDEGYFAGGGSGHVADSFPGSGVAFVTTHTSRELFFGRLTAGADAPTVWRRNEAGELEEQTLHVLHSSQSWRKAACNTLFLSHEGTAWDRFEDCVDPSQVIRRPPPPEFHSDRGPDMTPYERRAGADLTEWAPRDAIYVHFRSVEAAYRFAGEVDRLASALLDDGRDYGTLRLTLHDLLLPTIWRTNPESERGVGELALVVSPPVARGRLRAAVLLRITDPELHRMQTEAGIVEESSAGHQWRPADDPFPEERARRNFRRRVADVEIVATDESLLKQIAEGRGTLADDHDRVFERAPRPSGAQDEALVAILPQRAVGAIFTSPASWGYGTREPAGLRWLAAKWSGPARTPATAEGMWCGPGFRPSFALINWIRVTTDTAGARVHVKADDADSARKIAASLSSLHDVADRADVCRTNLEDLVPLALVENPQGDVAERNFVVLGWKPVCPCGGTYSVHPITREVSCSVHGTLKSPKAGKWTPPPISDVKVDGAELSFRLAIDWNRQR
jgi:hypothetical protein